MVPCGESAKVRMMYAVKGPDHLFIAIHCLILSDNKGHSQPRSGGRTSMTKDVWPVSLGLWLLGTESESGFESGKGKWTFP